METFGIVTFETWIFLRRMSYLGWTTSNEWLQVCFRRLFTLQAFWYKASVSKGNRCNHLQVVYNRLRHGTAIVGECGLCRLCDFTDWIGAKGHSPRPTKCGRVFWTQLLWVFTLKAKHGNHDVKASISNNDGEVVTDGPWHRNSKNDNVLVWAPFQKQRNTLTSVLHTTRQYKHSRMLRIDDGIQESQIGRKTFVYSSKNWFRSTRSSSW